MNVSNWFLNSRGLLALQSRGDIVEGVRLVEKALELDELNEFALETLGTIGMSHFQMTLGIAEKILILSRGVYFTQN